MCLDTIHDKIDLTPFSDAPGVEGAGFYGYKVVRRNAQSGQMRPVYFDNVHQLKAGGPWRQNMEHGLVVSAFANKPFTYTVGKTSEMVPKSKGIFVLPSIAECLSWATHRPSIWDGSEAPVIIEVLCWRWHVIATGQEGDNHAALVNHVLVKRIVEHLRRW